MRSRVSSALNRSRTFRVSRIPNLVICGTASFNNWMRFAHWSPPTSTLTPVMLPPGRARLGTMPDSIGSPKIPTIGIVLVAALTIEHKEVADSDNQIWIPTNYLASEVRIMRCTPFAGISLDQEIAPFDIA